MILAEVTAPELVDGVVAQLVERLVRNEKVAGSNPVGSTSLRSERSGERRLPRRSAKHAGGLCPTPRRFELRLGKPAKIEFDAVLLCLHSPKRG